LNQALFIGSIGSAMDTETEETVNLVFEVQTKDSEDSDSMEPIDLTIEGGSEPVKKENLFDDENDETISTNKIVQYKEYWLFLPEEINMVESDENMSTGLSMSQREQYESNDDKDDVIYREHKTSAISSNKNDKWPIWRNL
jgi:hypothetical protein